LDIFINAVDGIIKRLVTERFVKLIFELTFAVPIPRVVYGEPFINATDKLVMDTLDALINDPVTLVLPFINCVAVLGPVYNVPPITSVETDKLFTDVFVAVISEPVIVVKDAFVKNALDTFMFALDGIVKLFIIDILVKLIFELTFAVTLVPTIPV